MNTFALAFARARSALLFLTTIAASGIVSACTVHETRVVEPAPAPRPAPPPPVAGNVHPAYLHALTDLRIARFDLERRGGDAEMKWDEHDAIAAIDRAIQEIKQASIDDGKDLNDHPPADVHEPRAGRLHRALAALHTAHDDIAREEDNGAAQGLKARAIHHIDDALQFTERGVAASER